MRWHVATVVLCDRAPAVCGCVRCSVCCVDVPLSDRVFTPAPPLSSTGTLSISQRAEFDPERPSVNIVIEARDGGEPALSSLTTVQVQIADVNDNAPVFHQSDYRSVYMTYTKYKDK